MEDDDMFLVIVGDESQEGLFPMPLHIKQERFDDIESMPVEEILETAEKHGEYFQIKSEPVEDDVQYEFLEGDESQIQEYIKTMKTDDSQDEDYEPHDEDNIPDSTSENEDYTSVNTYNTKKKKHKEELRRFMLRPEDQKSFVEDLREEYPELRKNTKLLVTTLCEIMHSVKRPHPPDDFYIEHNGTLECPRCGHCSESIPAAGRHYQEKHGPRYLLCYACGVDFRSATNLYKHEKRCVAADRRVVLRARALFLGNKGRGRPYLNRTAHPPPRVSQPKFDCTECSATFHTRSNLQSHLYLHRGERPYQCHHCPAAYTSQSALVRHVKKHSDIQYICDHCGRSFKVKAALVVHMDTHRETRRFGCSQCGRRYAQKAALVLHVDRVHRNLPPPHACEICPKRYPRLSLLKNHMKDEHGLVIMTRKMFFKKLPMLSEEEMQQAAKVVFKADVDRQKYFKKMDDANMDFMDDEPIKKEVTLPENPTEEDLVEYFRKISGDSGMSDDTKVFIIQNGEVVDFKQFE